MNNSKSTVYFYYSFSVVGLKTNFNIKVQTSCFMVKINDEFMRNEYLNIYL